MRAWGVFESKGCRIAIPDAGFRENISGPAQQSGFLAIPLKGVGYLYRLVCTWCSLTLSRDTLQVVNRTSTGIQLAYEYAGGKSSPLPVAVDGPDTAEAGPALVEYIAEENVSDSKTTEKS